MGDMCCGSGLARAAAPPTRQTFGGTGRDWGVACAAVLISGLAASGCSLVGFGRRRRAHAVGGGIPAESRPIPSGSEIEARFRWLS